MPGCQMAEPVNLNKARKAREKAARETAAKHNRAKFGRTRAEKKLDAARAENQARLTDSHRLDGDTDKDG